ncbi:hypothetical protein VAB18032_15690 [Micromonospora maris AB-18-032]|nr:hypothetical protein VAB18032_15690 [Micromonospora maris AB-18-032]
MATNLVTAGHQVIGFHPAPAAERSVACVVVVPESATAAVRGGVP